MESVRPLGDVTPLRVRRQPQDTHNPFDYVELDEESGTATLNKRALKLIGDDYKRNKRLLGNIKETFAPIAAAFPKLVKVLEAVQTIADRLDEF